MSNCKSDYLSFGTKPTMVNNECVLFSSIIRKFNDAGRIQERTLVITNKALYNFQSINLKRRVPIEKIEAITISKISSEFVVHVFNEFDYRYTSYEKRNEIIEILLELILLSNQNNDKFKFYEVDKLNLNSVMTLYKHYQNKQILRPSNRDLVKMDLTMYGARKQEEKERVSSLRRRTTLLYVNDKKDSTAKQICIEDFELLKILGKGAFGKVILAQKRKNSKYYAIKILNKKKIIEMEQLEHTLAEKSILEHINHPFLVGLEYAFQTDQKIYFVLEFMQGGELFQHLRKMKRFPENTVKFYAACILLGIGHLHSKNFIYRDLKLENLLLDSEGFIMLTDFGLAKFLSSDEKALTFCGTPEYLAPEVITGKGHNRPADWWSFGILIYEMIFGIPPFYSSNVQKMYEKTLKEDLVFKQGISISLECKNLITKLLTKSPDQRLGSKDDIKEIIMHPWFSTIDFEKLYEKKIRPPFKPNLENWESNFDDEFIKEKIRESDMTSVNSKVDMEMLKKFQKEFKKLNFNTNDN